MRSGLEEFLIRNGVETRKSGEHKHARGLDWLQIDCNRCGPGSGKFHLGINTRTLKSNCWKCGRKDTLETLATITRQPRGAILDLLRNSPRIQQEKVAHSGTYQPPGGVADLMPVHRRYLEDRDFDPDELVKLWGIAGIGMNARLKWRVFIPIHDQQGKPVSWTTRSIAAQANLRYISASESEESVKHKTLLFGEQYVRNSVIVHEGPFDVFRTGPGACGTCGTGYTPQQLSRIARYPFRYICFDNEPSALRRARELSDDLSPFPGETAIIKLESAKDTAEAHPDEVTELRKLLF